MDILVQQDLHEKEDLSERVVQSRCILLDLREVLRNFQLQVEDPLVDILTESCLKDSQVQYRVGIQDNQDAQMMVDSCREVPRVGTAMAGCVGKGYQLVLSVEKELLWV